MGKTALVRFQEEGQHAGMAVEAAVADLAIGEETGQGHVADDVAHDLQFDAGLAEQVVAARQAGEIEPALDRPNAMPAEKGHDVGMN